MAYSETETSVVGKYLIVKKLTQDTCASNPLDSEHNDCVGKVLGNHRDSRSSEWSSMGDKWEFRSARGAMGEYNDIEIEDYREQAALLVALETMFEEAEELVLKEWEFTDEERADVAAYRKQVHTYFMQHVMKEYNASWPQLPSTITDAIEKKATELATLAVDARVVGDEYAIPLSLSGYYEMELKPDSHQSFSSMEHKDVLWIPGDEQRKELEALPYSEAMVKALDYAKSDSDLYAQWVSGNVFDVDVYVYEMEYDEDEEEFNEDADHYDPSEAIWQDSCGSIYGRDDAQAYIEEMEESAKKHIEGLIAQPAEAKPAALSM